MLKHFLSIATTLSLAASFVVYADSFEITDVLKTAYAPDSVTAQLDDPDCEIVQILEKDHLHIDKDSVMPLYKGSLLEYGETGVFELEEMEQDGMLYYTADVTDNSNRFAGVIEFRLSDNQAKLFAVHERDEFPSDPSKNLSFLQPIIEDSSFNIENLTVRTSFIEGAGYVYVLSDGKETILAPASIKAPRSEFSFDDESSSRSFLNNEQVSSIIVNTDLQEYGRQLAQKAKETQKYIESLPKGENPPTGGLIDAAPEKNSIVFFAIPILCLAVLSLALTYKRKYNNHTENK